MEGHEAAVQEYLDALTPDTCYIIHRSQAYAKEPALKIEPIYGSKFKVEKIEQKHIEEWRTVLPAAGETLFHCRENPFMPKGALVPLDCVQKWDKPIQISSGSPSIKSDVWFRQDSEFAQPYVWAKMHLYSGDNGFPCVEARVFNVLWLEMFKESMREMNYVAFEAGLEFKLTWAGEALGFSFFAYNDSFNTFFSRIFEHVQAFQPDEQFFNNKKD